MATNCTVEQRNSVRLVAEVVGAHPLVAATTVVEPHDTPAHSWELELVIERDALSPAVARDIARHNLHIADVSQRGEPTHTVVTVRP